MHALRYHGLCPRLVKGWPNGFPPRLGEILHLLPRHASISTSTITGTTFIAKHLPHSKNFRFNSDSSLVNKETGRGHEQIISWQGALKNDHVATRGGKSSRSHIFERKHWIKSQGDLLTFDILRLVHESQHFLCCYGGGPLHSSLVFRTRMASRLTTQFWLTDFHCTFTMKSD